MTFKLIARLTAAVLVCVLGSGCGPTPAPSSSSQAAPAPAPAPAPAAAQAPARPRIALVMKTLTNPFFVEMEKGARQAGSELGAELVVKTAAQETSIEQQIQILEQLIQSRVDAIVVAPGDSHEPIPVLKKAAEQGIKVVNLDNRLDTALAEKVGLRDVPFISVDNEQGAYLAAKHLIEQLPRPAAVAMIEGIPGVVNAEDRKRGVARAIAEASGVRLIASRPAHWKIDEAHAVTAALFRAHPEIQAIFCANDMMALGALQYLEQTGRKSVRVVGFDNLAEAQPALRTGLLAATVDQQAGRQGYLGVQYAVRALAGERLPAQTLVDVRLVTGSRS